MENFTISKNIKECALQESLVARREAEAKKRAEGARLMDLAYKALAEADIERDMARHIEAQLEKLGVQQTEKPVMQDVHITPECSEEAEIDGIVIQILTENDTKEGLLIKDIMSLLEQEGIAIGHKPLTEILRLLASRNRVYQVNSGAQRNKRYRIV